MGSTTQERKTMRNIITILTLTLLCNNTLTAADALPPPNPLKIDLNTSNEDGISQDLGHWYSSSGGRSHSYSSSRSWHSWHSGGSGHPGFHGYGSYRASYPGWHGYSNPGYSWSYPRTTSWNAAYGYPGYVYPSYTSASYYVPPTYIPVTNPNYYASVAYYNAYWSQPLQSSYRYDYRWRQYDNGTVFRYRDTRGVNFSTWTDSDGVTFSLGSPQGSLPTTLVSNEADKLSQNLGAKQAATTPPATAQPVPTVTPTPPPIQVEDDGLSSSFGRK